MQPGDLQPAATIQRTQTIEPCFQRSLVLLQQFPGTRRTRHRVASGSLLPFRHDVATHTIAQIAVAGVAGIFPPRDSGFAQRRNDFRMTQAEQRTQVHAAAGKRLHRTRCRQSAGAAAPREPHQHRFSDIILLVTEPQHPRFALQESMTRLPRLGLARIGTRCFPRGSHEGNPEPGANAATEIGIGPRRPPTQPMIKVQGENSLPALRPVRPKQQQQRERIGAAGKSHAPTAAARGFRPSHHRGMQALPRNDRGERLGALRQTRGIPCQSAGPARPEFARGRRAGGCSRATRRARGVPRGRSR